MVIRCQSCGSGDVDVMPNGHAQCNHCFTRHYFDNMGKFTRLGRVINTGGGAYNEGDVNVGGGDYIGRDQNTITVQQVSTVAPRTVSIGGHANDSVLITGDGNTVGSSLDLRVKEKGHETVIKWDSPKGSGKLTLTRNTITLENKDQTTTYEAPWDELPTISMQNTVHGKSVVRFYSDEELTLFSNGGIIFLDSDWDPIFNITA
jgi:hypothetical protein